MIPDLPLKDYEAQRKKDTSEHIHISLSSLVEHPEISKDEILLTKSTHRNGMVKVSPIKFVTISGHTKGITSSMKLFSNKVHVEKVDWSLHLQDSSHAWSKMKILNGEAVFPDFRTPIQEVKDKIKDFDNRIMALNNEKQAYLNDVFMTQPLTRFKDIPTVFFEKCHNPEALKKILEHYEVRL